MTKRSCFLSAVPTLRPVSCPLISYSTVQKPLTPSTMSGLSTLLSAWRSASQHLHGPWASLWQLRGAHHLAYDQVTSGPSDSHATPATVMLLHGLMGSGKNMRTFSRKLADSLARTTHSPWKVVTVDLRCHGNSARLHGFHPPHNLHAAAQDVLNLITTKFSNCPPKVLVGHSMGGKVLLELLQQCAHSSQHPATTTTTAASPSTTPSSAYCPSQVWILDSQPGKVTPAQESRTGVAKVLQTVQDIPLPIPSRTWLTEHLKHAKGLDLSLAQWLASSVVTDDQGKLVWAFHLPGVTALYLDYQVSDYWDVLKNPPQATDLHMVVGERSDRFSAADVQHLRQVAGDAPKPGPSIPREQAAGMTGRGREGSARGRFQLHMLPKAGHNVHMDNADGLVAVMVPQITSITDERKSKS